MWLGTSRAFNVSMVAVSAMLVWTVASLANGPTTATQRSVFSSNCCTPTASVPTTTNTQEMTISTQTTMVRCAETRAGAVPTLLGVVPMG